MRKIDWVFLILFCVFVGLFIRQQFQFATHERIFEGIVKCIKMDRERDEVHEQTDSLLVANINGIFEYLGVTWKIERGEQDTTIDSLWGQEPIPLPVGLEMSVKRAIQEIKDGRK